jgi:hypothetical protein
MLQSPNFFTERHTKYTECQAFCPVVRIGSQHLHNRKRVLLVSLCVQGWVTQSLAGEEVEVPNSDEGTDSLVLYVHII